MDYHRPFDTRQFRSWLRMLRRVARLDRSEFADEATRHGIPEAAIPHYVSKLIFDYNLRVLASPTLYPVRRINRVARNCQQAITNDIVSIAMGGPLDHPILVGLGRDQESDAGSPDSPLDAFLREFGKTPIIGLGVGSILIPPNYRAACRADPLGVFAETICIAQTVNDFVLGRLDPSDPHRGKERALAIHAELYLTLAAMGFSYTRTDAVEQLLTAFPEGWKSLPLPEQAEPEEIVFGEFARMDERMRLMRDIEASQEATR